MTLVDAIAGKMGIEAVDRGELEDIKQDAAREAVLDGFGTADPEP